MKEGGLLAPFRVAFAPKQHGNACFAGYFSACTFCFPISDHVMLLEGIVSFKCRLMHVEIYA